VAQTDLFACHVACGIPRAALGRGIRSHDRAGGRIDDSGSIPRLRRLRIREVIGDDGPWFPWGRDADRGAPVGGGRIHQIVAAIVQGPVPIDEINPGHTVLEPEADAGISGLDFVDITGLWQTKIQSRRQAGAV
jgi:hypothetical protein